MTCGIKRHDMQEEKKQAPVHRSIVGLDLNFLVLRCEARYRNWLPCRVNTELRIGIENTLLTLGITIHQSKQYRTTKKNVSWL